MSKPTYEQIANDFALWGEFFDTGANMTEEEFDALTTDQKVALQVEAFGPEQNVVTIAGNTIDFDAAVNLMDDELREQLSSSKDWASNQEFSDAYAAAHKARFDEEFTVA